MTKPRGQKERKREAKEVAIKTNTRENLDEKTRVRGNT